MGELNPVLSGWGNYFRTGNADREFNQMDGFVSRRSTRWWYRRRGQRPGRKIKWTRQGFGDLASPQRGRRPSRPTRTRAPHRGEPPFLRASP
ncbi:MAG: hypothetical protein FJW31_13015 [Acidobacteria bacterium]|nr:hypothetical protein [Acidobacteriota bacterium]